MVFVCGDLLHRTGLLIERAKTLIETARNESSSIEVLAKASGLEHWLQLTEQVCETARRRVLLGESVPNYEKLFSLFETHTQLYRRGKAGQPNQYGRLALIYEDGSGFISHYHLMDREVNDRDVVVEQARIAQRKHRGKIVTASFDRGFQSEDNETDLHEIIDDVCVLPRHPGQCAERIKNDSVRFQQTRLQNSGVEAAIGVMQRGNGLKRCRDRGELGFERYLGLAILGRNIHILGKLFIATKQPLSACLSAARQTVPVARV